MPLAITSTNAMIKRIGGKRWRALHRLAYVAAIAGVIHYYMQVKADVRRPLAFATALAILLGYRLMVYSRRPQTNAIGKTPVIKSKVVALSDSGTARIDYQGRLKRTSDWRGQCKGSGAPPEMQLGGAQAAFGV